MTIIRAAAAVVVLTVPLCLNSGCSQQPDLIGRWNGAIDIRPVVGANPPHGTTTMPVTLTFRKDGDRISATMATVDESSNEVEAAAISIKESNLSFDVPQRHAHIEVKLNHDGTELNGTFMQQPYTLPLALKRISAH
jgi:hypothetical protein